MKKAVGTVASIAVFAVIATGAIWGSFALREAQSVAPEPTAVVQVQPRGFVSEPTVTPTPTPEPVVEVAPEPEAPTEESGPAPGSSGSLVPFIPSDDPENANGGDYVDPGLYCDSGSASTIDGQVVCD